MDTIEVAFKTLNELCRAIEHFQQHILPLAIYRAPVIDHFHPDEHQQRGIAGLSRFLSHAQSERAYVEGLLHSHANPKDLTTNAPNLSAIWNEFTRAKWPLVAIAHPMDCGSAGQIKVDIVTDGGNQWIKVNTVRLPRLLAEFREQDSYVNSDFDSDSDQHSDSSHLPPSTASALRRQAPPMPLQNSLIEQSRSLTHAARSHIRPTGLPPVKLKYVLSRLEVDPSTQEYGDDRVEATLTAIKAQGIEVVTGALASPPYDRPSSEQPIVPASKIMLDLSVLVALCCDSTHHPLPNTAEELEARFRILRPKQGDGDLTAIEAFELAPHTNVTKDLRDQLKQEMAHPLITELKERLDEALAFHGKPPSSEKEHQGNLEFWVTREVKSRLPAIVDFIGGTKEKQRARALFGESTGVEGDFWVDSRWEGQEGILKDIRIRVLEEDQSLAAMDDHPELPNPGNPAEGPLSDFERRLVLLCREMIQRSNPISSRSDTPPAAPPPSFSKNKLRRSKNPNRPNTSFPSSRLPSTHTLRTLYAGVSRGMTVLTNNRGAVGKVLRDMGVHEGIPFDRTHSGRAAIWVVNPSSLAEWRREEVEESNRVLLAGHLQ